MDAKDLMIGDYVYYNDKVISIAPKAIMEFYYLGDTHSDSKLDRRDYKPIPLTEDILVNNCGFDKLPESEYTINTYELHGIQIWVNNGQFLLLSKYPIDYLHELQQLYKTLTKKELEVKL